MFKKRILFIILTCFSFLLIPQEYWHHCEQAHQEQKESSSVSIKQGDCFVCDFHFYPSENPNSLHYSFNKHHFLPKNQLIFSFEISNNRILKLRGPPSI